ncbi:unnamed protein product [Rangifer tarandus platyrhynchus]|uniref:Uncharacterized protein n=1 Tax=Rangifer tarandus platyrhynchus TaxID=3082113 RepID=A0ABN8Y4S5_RANTA|nr:unnamed protein product [Rangifer tarandus platyrhynchus]
MVEAAAGEQGNEWRGREEPASHSPGDRGWRNRSLSEGSLCRAVSMAFPGVALGPRVSGRAAEGRRAPLPGLCRRGPAALQPASAPGPAARPLGGLSTWPEACLPTPLFVALPPLSPCSAFTVHKVTLFGPDPLFSPSAIIQEAASRYPVCSEDKNNPADVIQAFLFWQH